MVNVKLLLKSILNLIFYQNVYNTIFILIDQYYECIYVLCVPTLNV